MPKRGRAYKKLLANLAKGRAKFARLRRAHLEARKAEYVTANGLDADSMIEYEKCSLRDYGPENNIKIEGRAHYQDLNLDKTEVNGSFISDVGASLAKCRFIGKMNGSDSFYVRGKQIMSVNIFVREIEGLRIRSKENKIFGGHLLPVVRVENDSPSKIRQKIADLKKGSDLSVRDCGISLSSEDENQVDDPQPSVISSSKTPLVPSASSRISSHSDGSDSETLCSDDEVLPDLSEISDPSFNINRKRSPEKIKSPRRHLEKKKKKKMMPKHVKSREGKLMKAAKQNWLAKKEMFVVSSKDKRVLKNDQENGKSPLNSEGKDKSSNISFDHKLKPSPLATHSFKTTGIAELKPYAKSPKDVERKLTSSTDTVKTLNDSKVINRASTKEQEMERQSNLRMLLQKRLESPPPIKSIECKEAHISEKSSFSELNTTQDSQTHEYDSDDTIIYEETASNHVENVLPDIPAVYSSKMKRKSSADRDSNKKLKTTTEPSSGLRFVPSPVPFVVHSPPGSETEGEQHIRIQQVEGGITDAFQSPQSSSTSESNKLKLLKEKMEKKTGLEKKLNSVKEMFEENLKREKAEYERRVSMLESNYKKEVDVIGKVKQKLEDEINSILMYGEEEQTAAAESQAVDAASTMPTLVPLPEEESLQEEILPIKSHKTGPKRTKLLNIISDANINKFGTLHNSPSLSDTEKSGGSAIQMGTPINPLSIETPTKRKRGRPKLNKQPPVSNVASSSSRTSSAMPMPPVYSVAPETAQSKQKRHQTSQNVVVTPDGTIKAIQRHPKTHGEPPPYYESLMSRMEKVQPNPSNPSVHSPHMRLSSNQSTLPSASAQSQILVQLAPSFQTMNQSQINSQFQPQSAIQIPPQFQAQNSSLLFVPSQGVIPTSGPVIVNSVSDSQMINYLEHPASDAQSGSETVPSFTLPSTTQLPVVSQALSYVPSVNASRASMASARRPTQHQKSHLLVAAQPSIVSSSAAQAKAVPSNQGVIASHALAKSATVFGEPAKSMHIPKVFGPNEEERSSSPEAEQSCFLCGSPGGFVCCNSIVYCSEDCKSKDWVRHSAECAHNNRN
ncbi:uncharacterized protein [Palaemon carinicauda]|uniref:uncharacterized protein isoform X2 n=1 Tax=Palaemon carinicauda TaxID=392227 RepID=UPI0035B65156